MYGDWSLEVTANLSSGINSIIARTEFRESATFTVNVETAADVPVTITYAYDNVGQSQYLYSGRGTTDDTRPTFYGTAGAGQLVTLYSGENVLGSVLAGANGSWSLEITTDLNSGYNTITARTEFRESATFDVNVESPADVPITIIEAYDNVGARQYLESGVGKTDDTRPTFIGRAGAGQLVTLYSGEVVLGSILADLRGNWSLEITYELPMGEHHVVARTSTQSSSVFDILIELPGYEPVTIERAFDSLNYQDLENGIGETFDTRPTFTGRAGAGQIVTLYDGEIVLGSVQANSTGRWSLEISTELTGGANAVIARTENRESDAFFVNVIAPDQVPVSISHGYDDVGEYQGAISHHSTSDDVRPSFTGFAGANQIVTLYTGDLVLGSVQANYRGVWVMEIDSDLVPGSHAIIAKTVSQQSAEFVLHIEAAQPPVEPEIPVSETSPVVKPVIAEMRDPLNGELLQEGSTSRTTPIFSGIAAPFAEITLTFNLPGNTQGSLILQVLTANENGEWSSDRQLPRGVARDYEIRVVVNGETSDPVTVRIDPAYIVPPVESVDEAEFKDTPVTIATAYDNVNNEQYLGNHRGITDDTRPTFYGMAGENQIVTLYSGEKILGSVQANANGEWFVEITHDLAIGFNDIVARTETHQSEGFVVIVASEVTAVTLILNDSDNEETIGNGDTVSAIPTLSGTAAPFSLVELTFTTESWSYHSSVYASEEGKWQQTPDFLVIDNVLGSTFEIVASSGDSTSDTIVVNISSMQSSMTDILIDSNMSLFNELPHLPFEENLVLSINEADMHYQSEGAVILDVQSRPLNLLSQEEQNYLVNGI
nr:Ig-like domain-containing protein [Pantoea sp. B9002]